MTRRHPLDHLRAFGWLLDNHPLQPPEKAYVRALCDDARKVERETYEGYSLYAHRPPHNATLYGMLRALGALKPDRAQHMLAVANRCLRRTGSLARFEDMGRFSVDYATHVERKAAAAEERRARKEAKQAELDAEELERMRDYAKSRATLIVTTEERERGWARSPLGGDGQGAGDGGDRPADADEGAGASGAVARGVGPPL